MTLSSEVKGCAFHNGLGWGANILSSDNIVLDNNIWFMFKPIGVGMDYVNDITFTNNVVAVIDERADYDV